jgi:hypothetical protein
LLAYPRANADNPVVPWPAFRFLRKLPRNLCVLIKERSVFLLAYFFLIPLMLDIFEEPR